MEAKRFKKNDEGFICLNCGKTAPPLGYSSRNHCPRCLYSLHADENPGDRAASCRGLMRPFWAEPDARKGYIISHRCELCGAVRRNRAASDDNLDLIIRLTVREL
ncbi:MAG: RNHCP domain-containing protein [Eubacteriales bacterium]|jgi:hypothetical protein|nr:RNHCP domain-containing protein [Eubacteriales bacterium]